MNIEEFIQAKGDDAGEVLSGVARALRLDKGETLIAVGSLAEGMGTSRSDLDVILITPGTRNNHVPVSLIAGKCLIDVRVLPQREWKALIARFRVWADLPWDVVHSVQFTLDERTLLHRVLRGRVLFPSSRKKNIPLPDENDLVRLKLHVARQMVRTIQVDLAGYREVGDFRSLAYGAQEVLGYTADALAALYGHTNPLLKWRTRLLDLLPSDWEESLPLRPSGLSATQRFWALGRLPSAATRKAIITYAMRITAFSRAVFAYAESSLVSGLVSLPLPKVWPRLQSESPGNPLPFLDLDVDFSLSRDGAHIGRLNAMGDTLQVSPSGLSLALLFDGITTAREASVVLFGSGNFAALTNVKEILSSISRAGFCC